MKRLGAVVTVVAAMLAPAAVHAADAALTPQANEAYLARNAQRPGVAVRPDGLQYNIVKSGYGERPRPTDEVDVVYSGWLINGKMFDGTEAMTPAHFTVNKLIPGWTEALQLMRVGDRWHIVIPANLAYGARGAGDGVIPPNQTLVFDMELLGVTHPKGPPGGGDDDQQQ